MQDLVLPSSLPSVWHSRKTVNYRQVARLKKEAGDNGARAIKLFYDQSFLDVLRTRRRPAQSLFNKTFASRTLREIKHILFGIYSSICWL